MNEPFAEMLRYNRWANLTLFDACRSLDDEQLDTRVAGTSGSVRELLLHVAGGQQTFVLRTQGRQHEGELTRWSTWPGFDTVFDVVIRSSDELVAIAEAIEPSAEVDLRWQGKVFRFRRSFFLVHAMEHGAGHRAEIKVALGSLGLETPDLDAWWWAEAIGYGHEV